MLLCLYILPRRSPMSMSLAIQILSVVFGAIIEILKLFA